MTHTSSSRTAVLLIAHGSRRPEANADLDLLAAELRKRSDFPIVETAYLELAAPDIPSGAQRCIERGASRVLLLPYFLSAGAHVTQDLEGYRRQFEAEFPDVEFCLRPHLGLHPLMIEIVLDRLGR